MPKLRPFVLGATTVVSLLCPLTSQQAQRGERVPAAAISPLVLETMDQVLERQKTMQLPKQELPIWNGEDGRWFVPGDSAKTPAHSGAIAIVNEWGDPRMAIGFPQLTDVSEVWAAGHGAAPARALRVIGYRAGKEVARTGWNGLRSQQQQLVPLALTGVDRIEFEAAPTVTNMAFFALDDLKFAPAGQPQAARVLDFEDLAHKTILDGGNYAGLSWLRGNGFKVPVKDLDMVPAPRSEPEAGDAGGAQG